MAASRIIDGGHELLAQFLTKFHTPLVEGVDAPDHALREHAVLVEGNQSAQGGRIEPLEHDDGARTAPRIDLVRRQRLDLRRRELCALKLGAHCLGGLAVGERLGLC